MQTGRRFFIMFYSMCGTVLWIRLFLSSDKFHNYVHIVLCKVSNTVLVKKRGCQRLNTHNWRIFVEASSTFNSMIFSTNLQNPRHCLWSPGKKHNGIGSSSFAKSLSPAAVRAMTFLEKLHIFTQLSSLQHSRFSFWSM